MAVPPINKPIVKRHGDFAEVFLSEQILVPHDQLDDADLVSEGEVDGKIKRGVLWVVHRVEGPFQDRGLLAVVEDGDDDEACERVSRNAT